MKRFFRMVDPGRLPAVSFGIILGMSIAAVAFLVAFPGFGMAIGALWLAGFILTVFSFMEVDNENDRIKETRRRIKSDSE